MAKHNKIVLNNIIVLCPTNILYLCISVEFVIHVFLTDKILLLPTVQNPVQSIQGLQNSLMIADPFDKQPALQFGL